MRTATGIGIVAALFAMVGGSAVAEAQPCGDPNRTGTVTVADGVLVLRAAAELPATCPEQRCDMNLDGQMTVVDGVLTLRLAAELQTQFACSEQASQAFFGALQKTVGFGQSASAAARARAAGSTIQCSRGGFFEDDGVTQTFFDCHEGNFITNGTIDFIETDDAVSLSFDTTDFVVVTGETFSTLGTLEFTFGESVTVNGFLEHASDVLGIYNEEFFDVVLDDQFFAVFGQVDTIIVDGRDLFANLTQITTHFYSPSLAQIVIVYVSSEFDIFMIGNGLCEPCSAGCSNPSLTCLGCVANCGQTPARCAPDFFLLECEDGTFAASGLCTPCATNGDCNSEENLSCFPCDRDCTGTTNRCASTIAFVECEDGQF